MTCAEWQAWSIDLARGVPLSPALRAEAQTHFARCAHCARVREEQRQLTLALGELKRIDEEREPSAALDHRVLAAWQAHQARAPQDAERRSRDAERRRGETERQSRDTEPLATEPLAAEAPSAAVLPWRRLSVAATIAAAAAVVLVGLVGLFHSFSFRSPPSPASTPVRADRVRADTVQAKAGQTGTGQARTRQTGARRAGAGQAGAARAGAGRAHADQAPVGLAGAGRTESGRTGAGRAGAGQAGGDQTVARGARAVEFVAGQSAAGQLDAGQFASGQRASPAAPFADAASEAAFVRLPYAEPLRPTEMRQVLRVTIPGMDRLGRGLVPTRQDGGSAVVADVLVGEDGMARAIRIVH